MKLNRKIAPTINNINDITFIKPNIYSLENGLQVYAFKSGEKEITRIEIVFKAGAFFQQTPLIASSTNRMLCEGTKKYDSKKIANIIDFYGSYLELDTDNDNAYITLYSLNKYLEDTLGILKEVAKNPIFPKKELNIYLANKKQDYLISLQKVSNVARRKFATLIYGKKHPYGMPVKEEIFSSINSKDLLNFYQKYYSSKNCYITVSGNLPDNIIENLNVAFGKQNWGANNIPKYEKKYPTMKATKEFVKLDNVMQSSIRVGCTTINRLHKDYISLTLLNTVLGGYFGSRLMSNIRENKGYTYGIGSGVASFQTGGLFFIATDVGIKFTKNTIVEIYKELDILTNELIPIDELETVKKYVIGNLIRNVDGAFAMANIYKTIIDYDLPEDYFNKYVLEINNKTSSDLLLMAQKYLNKEKMTELIVGQK